MNFNTQTGQRSGLCEIVFNKFSCDGQMTVTQFKAMCEAQKYEDVAEEEMDAAFVRLDKSEDGYIEYDEFAAWWNEQAARSEASRELGLKFRSDKERKFVASARKSFFVGTQGSEEMTADQFQVKCYLSGYCLSDEELDEAFSSLDKDGSGSIDFAEYLRWRQRDDRFQHLQFEENDRSEYVHTVGEFFRQYDTDLTGFLTIEQFTPLYESLVEAGEIETSLEDALREVDPANTGNVSLNEFLKWYVQ